MFGVNIILVMEYDIIKCNNNELGLNKMMTNDCDDDSKTKT